MAGPLECGMSLNCSLRGSLELQITRKAELVSTQSTIAKKEAIRHFSRRIHQTEQGLSDRGRRAN